LFILLLLLLLPPLLLPLLPLLPLLLLLLLLLLLHRHVTMSCAAIRSDQAKLTGVFWSSGYCCYNCHLL
jgi:hypothetical protein